MKLTTRQKMAGARLVQRPLLAARRFRTGGEVVRTRRRGVRWELDLREGIDFSIWLRGYFEPTTVKAYRRLLRPGSTAIDVGANIGAHTLHLAKGVGPTGRVVAFEPAQVAFRRLGRNIELNDDLRDRIVATQMMLLGSPAASLPREVVASWPLLPSRQLHPTIPGRPQPTEGASVSTLDAALESLGVGAVDLIKLDVDGYECDVIEGSSITLSRNRPVILVELAPFILKAAGRDIFELVERLEAHDYTLLDLRGRRRVRARDVERLAQQNASMNVIAQPDALGSSERLR